MSRCGGCAARARLLAEAGRQLAQGQVRASMQSTGAAAVSAARSAGTAVQHGAAIAARAASLLARIK